MLDPQRGVPNESHKAKPRLAIVSTFDDLCGIAGYTRFLIKQIEMHFDVEVFDLDQFFMRSRNYKVRKQADEMIRDYCRRMSEFDFVNVQLEHGTLGRKREDILERFRMIATAAPALSVTFHSVLPQDDSFPWGDFGSRLKRGDLRAAATMIARYRTNKVLNHGIYTLLRRLQRRKPVRVIVHTRRDMRLMKYVNGVKEVFDHPLSFLSREEAQRLRDETKRSDIAGLANLPADAKLIGVFGFLNEYKGFHTAIRALHLLPSNFHLALFGGLHPSAIKQGEPVNAYVRRLMDETYADRSVLDALPHGEISMSIAADKVDQLFDHPKNIGSRVHFMGTQTDDNFARGMAVCDFVVLPYHEIGQSSSGPMSIALEMGARILASRNGAFLQFARYHPDVIEFFEIGNHLELAERIRSPRATPSCKPRYDVSTNAAVYIAANTKVEAKRTIADVSAQPTLVT